MCSAATSASLVSAKASSERARERQVLRYLPYWLLSTAQGNPEVPGSLIPRSSADTGLTAFAQLAALRLNVKRVLISLTDRRQQYIIAEATRTLSLLSDDTHARGDALWFGVRSVLRGTIPMCDYAINKFARDGGVKFIIDDVSKDRRFKDTEFVACYPSVRAYMCVPIRSPTGHVIGSFCVLDDNCKKTVREIEWQFMSDMAATVMDHLLTQKALREERRGEKMVKALGLFMEGKSSLSEWSEDNTGQGLESPGGWNDGRTPVPDHGADHDSAKYRGETPLPRPAIAPRSDSQVSTTDGGGGIDVLFRIDADVEKIASNQKRHIETRDLPAKFSASHLQDSLPSTEVQTIFGRASHLIREGLGVEGAIFFDVGFSPSGATPKPLDTGLHSAQTGASGRVTSSSEDDISSTEGNLSWERDIQTCHVLGYSTTKSTSIDGKKKFRQHVPLPESFVKKLLKRYHQGKVFHVDEDGSLSASDDGSQSNEDRSSQQSATSAAGQQQHGKSKASKGLVELQTILRALPGARSVAFYPLWDYQRARWYASCLVWTTDPLRILHETKELTYLMAFGSSIMAEISKLDMLLADRAKADFISSVSHELRSPLHGILATIDIIRETDINPVQESLIKTVHSCGKTLLDTINHVLDFTKINSLTKSRRKLPGPDSTLPPKPSVLGVDDLYGDVDISYLLEEVADCLLAAQRYPAVSSSKNFGNSNAAAKPVILVLDIDWAYSWLCSVSLGAWRRVIMNLVNNSLKYTERGHVKVSLSFGAAPRDDTAGPVAIRLSVKDSGRGMSKSFLQNHLYTPFLQEDPLSEGTGLGVSIVRKIVDSLGGQIHFRSEQGCGTEVDVVLPVVQPASSPQMTPFVELQNKLKGRTIGIFLSGLEFANPPFDSHTVEVIQSDISRLCYSWFGLSVTTCIGTEHRKLDIVIVTEHESSQHRVPGMGTGLPASCVNSKVSRNPIVLCTDMCHGFPADNMDGATGNPVFLYQPIGPRSLAAALEEWVRRELAKPADLKESASSPRIRCSTSVVVDPTSSGIAEKSPNMQSPDESAPSGSQFSALPCRPFDGGKDTVNEIPSPPVVNPSELEAQEQTPAFPGENRRLLLVDDNDINRKILEVYMKKIGYGYGTACNGLEALEKFKAERFDLVFMDISMPVMDGLISTREIRHFEKANEMAATPVIALTGVASASIQQEAVDSGVTLFLTKPVGLKQLKIILSDIFGGPDDKQ